MRCQHSSPEVGLNCVGASRLELHLSEEVDGSTSSLWCSVWMRVRLQTSLSRVPGVINYQSINQPKASQSFQALILHSNRRWNSGLEKLPRYPVKILKGS